MKFRQILAKATILSILLLASCVGVTSYHPAGIDDGYSEIITSSDSYLVTFKGNRYTPQEVVMKYALARASELTLQNGYKYFAVVSSVDQTQTVNYSNTRESVSESSNIRSRAKSSNSLISNSGSLSLETYSGVIRRPAITMGVKCFNEKPLDLEVIDAQYYLEKNPTTIE